MAIDKKVEESIKRRDRLVSARSTWASHWQEICNYFIPRKATITRKGMPGEKRMTEIYDSTAFRALDILGAGLSNYLTSSVNKWFAFKTEDDNLMEIHEVKEWLQETERRTYNVLNGSNFGNEMHESYLDDASIGTSILYIDEDPKDIVQFQNRHISECCIAEDSKGRVDTLFRSFPMTARQAIQEWGGTNLGIKIVKEADKKPENEFDFIHVVLPRDEYDSRKRDRLNMPWASIYINAKEKRLISEGGYHEMPYIVSRWLKGAGEVYGRSASMIALPDAKMLNEMSKTTLKAAQKAVLPTLILPDDGVVGTVRNVPGGIIYLRASAWAAGMKPETIKQGGDIRLGLEMEDQRRKSINQSMFVDLFLMLTERPEMTATEVIERVQERMSILGPVLTRAISEKLDPLMDRVFGILMRRRYYPPPPEILRGQKIVVEYVSLLARVQKLYEVKAIRQTFADVGPYLEMFPEMADNVNSDELFDVIADVHAFPQRARRDKRTIRDIRSARQKVSEQEVQKEDLAKLVSGIATLKKAGIDLPAGMH